MGGSVHGVGVVGKVQVPRFTSEAYAAAAHVAHRQMKVETARLARGLEHLSFAACAIQAAARRRHFRRVFGAHRAAVTAVTAHWRGRNARAVFDAVRLRVYRRSTDLIATHLRSEMIRGKLRDYTAELAHRQRASVVMAAAARRRGSVAAVNALRHQRRSSILIQARVRQQRDQGILNAARGAARTIEAHVRGLLGRTLAGRLMEERDAATAINAMARRRNSMRAAHERREAATALQALARRRGSVVTADGLRLVRQQTSAAIAVQAAARRRASIKVADEQRDWLRSLADAATSVEKHFRGLMGRRASVTLMNANTRAATTIEAAQRGRLGRQLAAEMRAIDAKERAATRLAAAGRGLRGRRQSVAVAAEAREATDLLIKVLQARRNRGDMTQKFRDLLKSVSKMQAMIRRKKIADRSGWLTMPMVSPARFFAMRARAPLHPARRPSLYPSGNTSEGCTHLSPRHPLFRPIISPRTPHLSGARRECRRS